MQPCLRETYWSPERSGDQIATPNGPAIVIAFAGVYRCAALPPAVAWVIRDTVPRPIDLSRRQDAHIGGNATVLVQIASLLASAILAITAALRQPRFEETTPRGT